jgi:hypothetical protein
VLAHEADDTLSVLLELSAPVVDGGPRHPTAFQVVLDHSGSMAGPALEGAKAALLSLVDRLHPQDAFGLVVFDDEATVVVPAAPLSDKARVKQAIAAVHPGRSTDLAAGYLLGLQEARRVLSPAGATLVLVSDGHANAGERDPDRLGPVAGKAHADGITTSTLGYGLGFDETLLAALSRAGGGNQHFAEDPDVAGQHLAGEVTGLLSQAAQAVSLLVQMAPTVRGVKVVNDLPCHVVPEGRPRRPRRPVRRGDPQARPHLRRPRPARAGARRGGRAGAALRRAARARAAHGHPPAPGERGPRRRRRGPGAQPRRADRARVPAGADRQAPRLDPAEPARHGESTPRPADGEECRHRRARRCAGRAPQRAPRRGRRARARMEEEAQYGDLSRAAKVTSSDAARKSRQRARRPS